MTNLQIIVDAAITSGLYTESEVTATLQTIGELPLHTYQQWRKIGYQVRPGERAALQVDLWRWKPEVTQAKTTTGDTTEIDTSHHYKQPAYLFTASQVDKIAPAQPKDIKAYNAMLAEQRRARTHALAATA